MPSSTLGGPTTQQSPAMARTDKNALPKDFETALQELEILVADMESGRLNLEAALAAYKRGSELAAYCQKTLDAADQQVKVLDNGVLKNLDTGEVDD
ncbi:MAG: exodeoxyribonuclease VII small subunit [Pseudomonadota bacterium]|nr:exodeoxyribonuclease VII small subunit [Pseudomonadota bacterium]